ncbi:MAG: hypothetical protein M1820_009622 [Bogoriella megaspora]|nr:MAG: hypothetical protein M1820_009622 [Bogoriella megaspora]
MSDKEEATPKEVPFPPPSIATLPNGISVRRYHPTADIDPSAHHANDVRISRFMTNTFPSPYTRDSAIFWIDRTLALETQDAFVIAVNDQLVGGIGFKPMSDIYERTVVIGYWIGAEFWGRGIGGQVVKAFTAWVFRELKHVERIEAETSAQNVGSQKVLLKAGFVEEGLQRRKVFKLGEFHDVKVFAALRGEWKEA